MNTLACLIHAGMKRLMPDEDSGLGIEAEYQEAVRVTRRSSARPPTTTHKTGNRVDKQKSCQRLTLPSDC
jgi:hypothetical protein